MADTKKKEEQQLATETIEIIQIDDSDDIVPKERNKLTDKPNTITNIRALIIHPIVLHDNGEKTVPDFIQKCIDKGNESYHYIISKTGKIYEMLEFPYRALHAKFNKYSDQATNYFGDFVCPTFRESPGYSHQSNPNCCTIAIGYEVSCLDDALNQMVTKITIDKLIECSAYVLNKYARELEPEANILRVRQIQEDILKGFDILHDFNTSRLNKNTYFDTITLTNGQTSFENKIDYDGSLWLKNNPEPLKAIGEENTEEAYFTLHEEWAQKREAYITETYQKLYDIVKDIIEDSERELLDSLKLVKENLNDYNELLVNYYLKYFKDGKPRSLFELYRVNTDRLRIRWLAQYKEHNRGYPNLNVTKIAFIDNSLPEDL